MTDTSFAPLYFHGRSSIQGSVIVAARRGGRSASAEGLAVDGMKVWEKQRAIHRGGGGDGGASRASTQGGGGGYHTLFTRFTRGGDGAIASGVKWHRAFD